MGWDLKKMDLGGLARTACHEVPLRPHYVMRGAKLKRRKFGDWARYAETSYGGGCWHFGGDVERHFLDGTIYCAQKLASA